MGASEMVSSWVALAHGCVTSLCLSASGKTGGARPRLTSAVILAMSPAEMAPLSTFRRRPGFLGSLRLLMRLRRAAVQYFMSVLLSSW